MTSTELHFNALTDPWLPLVQEDGSTIWASPVEILCGEKDGVDLGYPRDDFRVYARLLLSALVQALFPARNNAELKLRIEVPLTREEAEAHIKPVMDDFDLFGPTPFLQVAPVSTPSGKGGTPFVFGPADLYQPAVAVDRMGLAIALVTIFAEQTYAGGAGRGYGAGPGGQPGALTLIDPGSVRRAAWANTLALERVGQRYAPDEPRPWSNAQRAARSRAAIGINGGLFFQPRAVWLVPAGDGRCSFSGLVGPLVTLSPLLPKSQVIAKTRKGEDFWPHPCAPLAVNSQGIGAIRLNAERPTWTGLAQLLDPVSKDGARTQHPLGGPAAVLQQWRALGYRDRKLRLVVLDFERDKASIKRRFFEAFPLTADLVARPELIERLRLLINEAQRTERALIKALRLAHDERKLGGLALADARSEFWTTSEDAFVNWLAAVADGEAAPQAGGIGHAQSAMIETLRHTAMSIFDAHASMSEFDPRKQERTAKARRGLRRALWPRAPRVEPVTPATEVTL